MTPSLNKSFKFQSDWPYNNSQVYLLDSIIDDLRGDDKHEFKVKKNGYYFSSKVNYPNNKSLVSQKIYVNNKENITKVEVVDKDDKVQIRMSFGKIIYDKKFNKDDFKLSTLLNQGDSNKKIVEDNSSGTNTNSSGTLSSEGTNTSSGSVNNTEEKKETKETAKLRDVVYPMYLPDNTYLTKQETIKTDSGDRLILTFGGDSSFVLVEEVASYSDEAMVIPVSGDITFLADVIGVINNNSIMWQTNGVSYYIASDTIETSELLDIARSISVLPVSK